MENNRKTGDMAANFKVPDTYGVYQFKVNYHTVGLTGPGFTSPNNLHIYIWDLIYSFLWV